MTESGLPLATGRWVGVYYPCRHRFEDIIRDAEESYVPFEQLAGAMAAITKKIIRPTDGSGIKRLEINWAGGEEVLHTLHQDIRRKRRKSESTLVVELRYGKASSAPLSTWPFEGSGVARSDLSPGYCQLLRT